MYLMPNPIKYCYKKKNKKKKQLTINKVTNKKKTTLVLINDALYILNKLYNICYQIVTS